MRSLLSWCLSNDVEENKTVNKYPMSCQVLEEKEDRNDVSGCQYLRYGSQRKPLWEGDNQVDTFMMTRSQPMKI